MSGVEFLAILGIGANILAVVDASNKIIERIEEYRRNAVFQDLALQLPLLVSAIQTLTTPQYREILDASTEKALIRVLEGCSRQLRLLEKIIKDLTPAITASKLSKTWKGIRSFGKDTKVREIVGILNEYKSSINLHVSTLHVRQLKDTKPSPNNDEHAVFEVPHTRLSHFVGRKDILERIQTTLDTKFCHRSSVAFRGVFWVDASSHISASRSYERILKAITKTSISNNRAENKELVKRILRGWKQPWLLVFDNYDDPKSFSDLSSFFPTSTAPSNSAVLITSRQISSGRLGTHLPLEGMSVEEGLQLLTSRTSSIPQSQEELNEGRKIVKTLGYLPLAIDQAAAYISIRQLPLHVFSEHFEKRKEFILKDTPQSLWEYRKRTLDDKDQQDADESQNRGENMSVLTTWELSFDQISGTDNDRQCIREFLVQAAFFDPSSISDTLFNCPELEDARPLTWKKVFTTDGSWDPFKYQDVIAALCNLSLISGMEISSHQVKFSLHPLVKDWLQLRETPSVRQTCVAAAITTAASFLNNTDTEKLELQTRQELLSHIDACARNGSLYLRDEQSIIKYGGYVEGFQTTFATFYGNHDRYADAERLFRKSLKLQTSQLTLYNIATLSTMNNLAALYLESNKLAEAESLLYPTLQVKEDMLGPDHPRTLNTVNNIGNLLVLRLDHNSGAAMYQRTLEGYQAINGPMHETVIESLNNLGELSMKRGRFEEAEELFTEANNRLRLSHGDEHSSLSVYLKSNIALVYKLQGRYQASVAVYLNVVEGRKALLGSKYSSSLQSMCELADVYYALGELNLADQWYQKGDASKERIDRGFSSAKATEVEAATLHSRFKQMASLNDQSIPNATEHRRDKMLGNPKRNLGIGVDRRGPLFPDNALVGRSGPHMLDKSIVRSGPTIPDDLEIWEWQEPDYDAMAYFADEAEKWTVDRVGLQYKQQTGLPPKRTSSDDDRSPPSLEKRQKSDLGQTPLVVSNATSYSSPYLGSGGLDTPQEIKDRQGRYFSNKLAQESYLENKPWERFDRGGAPPPVAMSDMTSNTPPDLSNWDVDTPENSMDRRGLKLLNSLSSFRHKGSRLDVDRRGRIMSQDARSALKLQERRNQEAIDRSGVPQQQQAFSTYNPQISPPPNLDTPSTVNSSSDMNTMSSKAEPTTDHQGPYMTQVMHMRQQMQQLQEMGILTAPMPPIPRSEAEAKTHAMDRRGYDIDQLAPILWNESPSLVFNVNESKTSTNGLSRQGRMMFTQEMKQNSIMQRKERQVAIDRQGYQICQMQMAPRLQHEAQSTGVNCHGQMMRQSARMPQQPWNNLGMDSSQFQSNIDKPDSSVANELPPKSTMDKTVDIENRTSDGPSPTTNTQADPNMHPIDRSGVVFTQPCILPQSDLSRERLNQRIAARKAAQSTEQDPNEINRIGIIMNNKSSGVTILQPNSPTYTSEINTNTRVYTWEEQTQIDRLGISICNGSSRQFAYDPTHTPMDEDQMNKSDDSKSSYSASSLSETGNFSEKAKRCAVAKSIPLKIKPK